MEVDIEVPPHLMDHFEEFCPLFVTCSIPTEAIGDKMHQYIKTYCLQVIDGQEKIAVKGINKSTLSPGVYQQMLDILQTGEDKLAVNKGFRMHKASEYDNKMMTYQECEKKHLNIYIVNGVFLKIKFILNRLILYLNHNIINHSKLLDIVL